jgi:alanine racemase
VIRCTFADVDLVAIQSNYQAVRALVTAPERPPSSPEGAAAIPRRASRPGPTRVLPVVKANAYGHGGARVALALERAGAAHLACADIEEAIVLREAGVHADILVFGALSVSDLEGLFEYNLTPTVSTPSAGRALERAAASRSRVIGYHLKIDTGMNRLGLRHDNLDRTLPELLASRHLRLDAVYTHFATADDPESELFNAQRDRFFDTLDRLEAMGLTPVARHAANSAALLRDARTWLDFVRPGLLLYGIVPPPLASTLALVPAMSLKSRVVAVKGVRAGEVVGYGGRFQADRPTRIAIVPAGYADGLDARLAGRGHVLVRGRRAAIVGAVSMDMMTLDVTGLIVEPGDEAVIIGTQGEEQIDVREMAAAIGTIPYEILSRIGTRIERVYGRVPGS